MSKDHTGRSGEFEFIDAVRRAAGAPGRHAPVGIGDDAAVLRPPPGSDLVVTTDMLVSGRHFDPAWMSPRKIGRRAVLVNLSDLAAMGARPAGVFASLAFPPGTGRRFMNEIARGIETCSREHGARLLGGDTNLSAGELAICITAVGHARRGRIVRRSGARPGDRILVTGTLGDAAMGLVLLKGETPPPRPAARRFLVRRFLEPEARLKAGMALAESRTASAMIDISDGLLSDLGHILEESGADAEIRLTDVPTSAAFRSAPCPAGTSREDLALGYGDDYELLFTVPPSRMKKLDGMRLSCAITEIGEIVPRGDRRGKRVRVLDERGRLFRPRMTGFRHF